MTGASGTAVAEYMIQRLNEAGVLYREVVARDIQSRFGSDFVFPDDEGALVIGDEVLSRFRRLTAGKVIWNRADRFWRFKSHYADWLVFFF